MWYFAQFGQQPFETGIANLVMICQWENKGSEKFSDQTEVAQFISGLAGKESRFFNILSYVADYFFNSFL